MERTRKAVLSCLLAAAMALGLTVSVTAAPPDDIAYSEYGAVGDGVTDDFDAIIAAHAAANAAGLPVRADPGAVYYIGDHAKTAVIQTDTDWGDARFIVDDSEVYDNRGWNIFEVRSALPRQTVTGIGALSKGQEQLGISLDADSLVLVFDDNVRHYIRKGGNANEGTAQSDLFMADKDGAVDPATPIVWDFAAVTRATAIPVDPEPLTVRGGVFTTIANRVLSESYYGRGLRVTRSNVTVDGIEHYVAGEGADCSPYSGFMIISECADITVQNCVFSGRKQVLQGTYDINPSRCVNVTFRNCTQANSIHDASLWGIMGSNFTKNLVYDGCSLSRFDAHQGTYDAVIRDSVIGCRGITLIGGGTFLMENTQVHSGNMISLRDDYGSTWDGEFILRDCEFFPGQAIRPALVNGSNDGRHGFGYPCSMPGKITVDGLVIHDKNHPFLYLGPRIFGDFDGLGLPIRDMFENPPHPYTLTTEVSLRNVRAESCWPLWKSGNFLRFWGIAVHSIAVSPGM